MFLKILVPLAKLGKIALKDKTKSFWGKIFEIQIVIGGELIKGGEKGFPRPFG